jgi:hypothetical protein
VDIQEVAVMDDEQRVHLRGKKNKKLRKTILLLRVIGALSAAQAHASGWYLMIPPPKGP